MRSSPACERAKVIARSVHEVVILALRSAWKLQRGQIPSQNRGTPERKKQHKTQSGLVAQRVG